MRIWIAGGKKDKLGLWWRKYWIDGFDISDCLFWRLSCSWVDFPETWLDRDYCCSCFSVLATN